MKKLFSVLQNAFKAPAPVPVKKVKPTVKKEKRDILGYKIPMLEETLQELKKDGWTVVSHEQEDHSFKDDIIGEDHISVIDYVTVEKKRLTTTLPNGKEFFTTDTSRLRFRDKELTTESLNSLGESNKDYSLVYSTLMRIREKGMPERKVRKIV